MPKRSWLLAALLAVPGIASWARAAGPVPRIVHGTLTAEHPTVGVLLESSEGDPDRFGGICTGTLVGCHSFIVAAHCVCPSDTEDATACLAQGTTSPARLRVFLPNVGILTVASVSINPAYSFAVGGDAAMIHLGEVAGGVRPMPVNTVGRPPVGTEGIISGYGTTGGPPFLASDFGVKRDGPVTTATCEEDIPNDTHICWLYDGTETSSCLGDSGGPLFVDLGTGPVLASVVSGGESFTCEPPDEVFNTDLYVIREWVAAELAGDTLDGCDDLPVVQDGDGAVSTGTSAEIGDAKPELGVQLSVPPGTQLLRVALNGQENSRDGFFSVENDFDLYVGAGGEVTEVDYDCVDTSVGTFAFCEIRSPVPGPWDVLVVRAAGSGLVQLTASLFAGNLRGDANCNDLLDAGDPLALAAIIAGVATDPCGHADANGDGVVNAADLEPTLAAIFHSNQ